MAEHTRRAFIRGAGVTAAAATVAVMVPGVATAASKSPSDDGSPAPDGSTGMSGYIHATMVMLVLLVAKVGEATVLTVLLAEPLVAPRAAS